MHAGATGHTASATKPRQLDICVSLDRTPTVIQPLAKWRFFFNLSAKAVTGVTPDQVTTDGHGSYPRAIRSTLGRDVEHRTSAYKNNRLEQDHRGVKGRTRCMRGFKSFASAERFCRSYDELRNFLRPCTRHNQYVFPSRRRLLHLRRATSVLAILEAA